jgi:hypothetical protein
MNVAFDLGHHLIPRKRDGAQAPHFVGAIGLAGPEEPEE